MSFIENPWTIGIGTSIISGFLVFFFTRKFFNDRQKKEYLQKIKTANNEILYSVRPLIVEKTKPDLQTLDSIFNSISQKYGIAKTDIYNTAVLCDDLIYEIMSNSFLSAEQKIELTELLQSLKNEKKEEQRMKTEKEVIVREIKINNSFNSVSYILAITTAMMALVISLYSFSKDNKELSLIFDNKEIPGGISIIIVATMIPILALVTTRVFKDMTEALPSIFKDMTESLRKIRKKDKK